MVNKKKSFVIQGRLPSLNDYILKNRANRFAGAKIKKDIEELIMWEIKSQIKGSFGSEKVLVKIHWVEANKKRDLDNICSAKKFILDSLVKTGILEGDGWRHISGFEESFSVYKEDPRVEVDLIPQK